MKTKFNASETVIYDGNEAVIKVARKDFGSGSIIYQLENGTQVEESELSKKGSKRTKEKKANSPELVKARDEYEINVGKPFPVSKKNDLQWLVSKSVEAIELKNQGNNNTDATPFEVLSKLTGAELAALIKDKKIESIDPQDYDLETLEGTYELLVAICEELKIDVPGDDVEED